MFLKKYLRSFLYIFLGIFLSSLLITTLSFFDLFTNTTLKYFKIIGLILSLLIGGIYIGKKSTQKGYLAGLKIGFFMIILLFLLNYLGFQTPFQIKSLLFYGIILSSSVLGSIIGINKNRKSL